MQPFSSTLGQLVRNQWNELLKTLEKEKMNLTSNLLLILSLRELISFQEFSNLVRAMEFTFGFNTHKFYPHHKTVKHRNGRTGAISGKSVGVYIHGSVEEYVVIHSLHLATEGRKPVEKHTCLIESEKQVHGNG